MNRIFEISLLRLEWHWSFPALNLLSASVDLIENALDWFAVQISWLVSIWGQHWHLSG